MQLKIDWHRQHAAVWRAYSQALRPVAAIDPVRLEDLVGLERQAQALAANTEQLLAGADYQHALLWGARGCGKSSLVKAIFNHYRAQGLRLVELDPSDLSVLPALIDALREQSQSFVLFIDDLGFDAPGAHSRSLKVLLEGSIELPPSNVALYVTANRRNLLPEFERDRSAALHPGDELQESASLSERFGLNLSFHLWDPERYLTWIAERLQLPVERFRTEAETFALARGARSGRVARQFIQRYAATDGKVL